MVFRGLFLVVFVAAIVAGLYFFDNFSRPELFQSIAVEIGGAILVAAITVFLVHPFKAYDAARKLRINHSQFHGIFVSTKPKHLNAAFIKHFADMARQHNSAHDNTAAKTLYLDYDAVLLELYDLFEAEDQPQYNSERIRIPFNKANTELLGVIKKLSWWEGRKFSKLMPRLTVKAGQNDPLKPSEMEKQLSVNDREREYSSIAPDLAQ